MDTEIGKAKLQGWAGPVGVMQIREIDALVNYYIAQPRTNSWWKAIVIDAAEQAEP